MSGRDSNSHLADDLNDVLIETGTNSQDSVEHNSETGDVTQQPQVSPTLAQNITWGGMQTLMMAVSSETVRQFTCPPKSLEAVLTLAVVVPLSIEWFKFAFNLSGALKEDFVFDAKTAPAITIEIAILMAAACGFYYSNIGKGTGVVDIAYDSAIIFPGVALKFTSTYFLDKLRTHTPDRNSEVGYVPLPEGEPRALGSAYAGQSYNAVALHGFARFPLLFCATYAGGQFFEAAGIPLAESLAAAYLTNFTATVAFSVLLNELIGSQALEFSGKFGPGHPNFYSRFTTMLAMYALGFLFQDQNVLAEDTMQNFALGFLMGFSADFAVQKTITACKQAMWPPIKNEELDNNQYASVRNPIV